MALIMQNYVHYAAKTDICLLFDSSQVVAGGFSLKSSLLPLKMR